MPKDISQKGCHTPQSETLRLVFLLIFMCQRNPRDSKCSFIFW